MLAGADCAHTLSDQTEEMNFDQFMEFLEPTQKRGGAICTSAEDFGRLKTAIEQACKKVPGFCTKEDQAALESVTRRMDELLVRAKKGRAG